MRGGAEGLGPSQILSSLNRFAFNTWYTSTLQVVSVKICQYFALHQFKYQQPKLRVLDNLAQCWAKLN